MATLERKVLLEDVMDVNLMPALARLIKGRYVILAGAVLGILLATAGILLIKPWYSSDAEFLPPKMQAEVAPTLSLWSGGDQSDLYIGLLQSRAVADDVIDQLHLMDVYHVKSRESARSMLATASTFTVDKASIIVVRAKASSPQLAAQIANAYTDALYRVTGTMATSGSAHRMVFLEHQMEYAQQQLAAADLQLKNTEERTGVVLPSGEAEANISSSLALQNEIASDKARLAALLASETEQNPEVQRLQLSLSQLTAELAQRQSATGHSVGIPANTQLPEVVLENQEKSRQVHLDEAIYASLSEQYEKARIAASDPGPQLQIVSAAVPAEHRAGPSRRWLMIGGFFLGILVPIIYLLGHQQARHFAARLRQTLHTV